MNAVLDTTTEKYLDYDGASDVKIWVDNIENAHPFTDQDLATVLAELNTPAAPERFVGRPTDRQK